MERGVTDVVLQTDIGTPPVQQTFLLAPVLFALFLFIFLFYSHIRLTLFLFDLTCNENKQRNNFSKACLLFFNKVGN